MDNSISIILPARNEAESLKALLPELKNLYPDAEVIVVNDASNDQTESLCREMGVQVITLPYNMGNGAAIKTGARKAKGEILVFMDADSQHSPKDVSLLLSSIESGFDMAIGARSKSSQAGFGRLLANSIYNKLASMMVGHRVRDLTSGFRAVYSKKFREFTQLLPNGFSYPTTITMCFFRAGYAVNFVPITTEKRIGKSHISILRDGVRFLLIIFRVGTLYSPLKLFLPISLFHFVLGLGYYSYTYLYYGQFTNMSALLFITSILIFLIGLVSEQITNLLYSQNNDK